jgi:hypothetical protein
LYRIFFNEFIKINKEFEYFGNLESKRDNLIFSPKIFFNHKWVAKKKVWEPML